MSNATVIDPSLLCKEFLCQVDDATQGLYVGKNIAFDEDVWRTEHEELLTHSAYRSLACVAIESYRYCRAGFGHYQYGKNLDSFMLMAQIGSESVQHRCTTVDLQRDLQYFSERFIPLLVDQLQCVKNFRNQSQPLEQRLLKLEADHALLSNAHNELVTQFRALRDKVNVMEAKAAMPTDIRVPPRPPFLEPVPQRAE